MPASKKNVHSENLTSWFNLSGAYDDVILSTKVRLARNLADFPFPSKMTEDDRERITSLIYDAFSSDENFHFVRWNGISPHAKEILKDKNYY